MRSEVRADAGVSPVAPFNELMQFFTHATIAVVAGLAVGVALARAMRGLRMHWSWAATALAVALLVRPASTQTTCAVWATLLTATLCGRRWQREDLDAGLDLAEKATARLSPRDLLHMALATTIARTRELAGAAVVQREGELQLGEDEHGRPAGIPLGGQRGGTHALITGATGSGKTVTQASIAVGAIARGLGAIVIDPKGDDHMRAALAQAAASFGRWFIEWTPDGPTIYNPYARGSDTEVADKVLASERFTEPHYQRQAQRYLGHVVRALRDAGVETSLRAIVEHLDPSALEVLVRSLPVDEHPTHA